MSDSKIIDDIKAELLAKDLDSCTVGVILEKCSKLDSIEQLLKVELEEEVVFIAFTTQSGTFIGAFDKRSDFEIGEGKITAILPDLFNEDKSLKDLFYSALELGGAKEKLYAIINNPSENDVDDGFISSIETLLKFRDRIPDEVKDKLIAQVDEVNGIIIVKAMEPYYPPFGSIYFIKEDTVKGIGLIGDTHIHLLSLTRKGRDLIIDLFEDISEPKEIQLLESVLRCIETPVKVTKEDDGFTLVFKDRWAGDIIYHIGDTSYISYDEKSGLRRRPIEILGYIKKSRCLKAYSLLDMIEFENRFGWRSDKFFKLDKNDKFQIVNDCEEAKE